MRKTAVALAMVMVLSMLCANATFAAGYSLSGYGGGFVDCTIKIGYFCTEIEVTYYDPDVFVAEPTISYAYNSLYIYGTFKEIDEFVTSHITITYKDEKYNKGTITIPVYVNGSPDTGSGGDGDGGGSDPVPTATPIPTPPPPVSNAGDLVIDDLSIPQDITPGQVIVELPLRYKGNSARYGLRFLEIAPIIDDLEKWPFEITSTSYLRTQNHFMTKTVPDGSRLYDYIPFDFVLKDDTYNGYYQLDFKVRYQGMAENIQYEAPTEGTLSIWIKVSNAQPAPTPTPSPKPERTLAPLPEAKLILSGFSTEPEVVQAGQPFVLTLEMYNTSEKTNVANIKCNLSSEDGSVVPAAGSSTFYVDKIAKGERYEVSINMSSQVTAGLKPSGMTFLMEYEDERLSKLSSSESFTIGVRPIISLSWDEPRYNTEIMAGDSFNLMFTFYNKGKSALNNVMVTLESDRLIAEDNYFAGNLDPGTSKTYDTMVMALSRPNEGASGSSNMSGAYAMSEKSASVSMSMGSSVAIAAPKRAMDRAASDEYVENEGYGEEAAPEEDDWVDPGYADGLIVITYEDSFGIEVREEIPMRVSIIQFEMPDMPEQMYDEFGNPIDPMTGLPYGAEPVSAGVPLWILLAGGGVVLVAAAVMAINIPRVRKRKRMENEDV